MPKRSLVSVATLTLLAASLTATWAGADDRASRTQVAEPPKLSVALAPVKTVLPNGLEVILDVDHRAPLVSVNVWYHVGSKDEAAHRNGFAHLFEHVMFQGSKHVPEDTYFRFLESAGATAINGTTSTDRTNYFETVPANQLELALWLESDRMGFLLDHADEKTFASQRDVVKNERRQNYENAPYGMVGTFVRAALFPEGHPYHLVTIGTPEDLDNASFEDVKAFFRKNYVPNNATLVLSGDIDAPKALALVEKYFGPIPRGAPVPRKRPAPVTLTGETRLEVETSAPLARVYMSWPSPPYFEPGDADLDVASSVLSSGKTSRLYKRLVYDLQIAGSVSAHQVSMELGGVFEIVATAQPGHDAAELARVIDEELAKLRTTEVDAAEIARARAGITSDLVFSLERGSTRADRINTYEHYRGDPGFFAEDLARPAKVTPASMREAVVRYLSPTARVLTMVRSTDKAPLAGKLVNVTKGGAR